MAASEVERLRALVISDTRPDEATLATHEALATVADFEAAVRAEERERIAHAIHIIRPVFTNSPIMRAFDGGLERAENIARHIELFEADPSSREFRA